MSSIGCSVKTLIDIEEVLGQLRISMDTAVYRGEEQAYYREHHREIRIISELMFFTIKELKNDHKKAQEIECDLFHKINERYKIKLDAV